MENLNRVLLENVLPAHVAEHFLGRNWKNEVNDVELWTSAFMRYLLLKVRFPVFYYYGGTEIPCQTCVPKPFTSVGKQ